MNQSSPIMPDAAMPGAAAEIEWSWKAAVRAGREKKTKITTRPGSSTAAWSAPVWPTGKPVWAQVAQLKCRLWPSLWATAPRARLGPIYKNASQPRKCVLVALTCVFSGSPCLEPAA